MPQATEDELVGRDIAKLTTAQRNALLGARYGPRLGGFYFRLSVRNNVLRALVEKGLASKRHAHLLTGRGERAAAALRASTKEQQP
jgi:hypothetical protein